jgi:hypothetical protein
MNTTTEAVLTYLKDLTQHGFWGFVTVKFENGCPVHLRREENLKPSELQKQLPERNRSRQNEHTNNQ